MEAAAAAAAEAYAPRWAAAPPVIPPSQPVAAAALAQPLSVSPLTPPSAPLGQFDVPSPAYRVPTFPPPATAVASAVASAPAAAATDARSAPRPTAATNDGLGPLPKDLVSLSLQPKVPCAYSGGSYIGGSAQSFAVPSQTVQQSTSMVPPVTRPSAPLAPGAVPGTTLLAGGASPFSGCGSCAPPPFSWDPTRTTTPPGHVGAQLGATGRAHGNPTGIGSNLRPLLIPEALISTFERLAASNTARNIETCGILVGTVVNGELRTDRLLLPSQTGTSDTCTTTDENEIWDYCSGQGACTFGWIHTHPTQTCFLSSMDLHTHCGYQSMLDEAVAIVLSPSRTPRHGVFRLSHPDPPGLRELQRCRKHGFHPDHQRNGQDAGNGVYEHSTHIRWTQTPIQVVDLRKPK
jgi:proteasome lid subunit RPN8/RPN11